MPDLVSMLLRVARCFLAGLTMGLGLMAAAHAADDFLAPEKAFQFSARMAAPGQAEVTFRIADGYYLYRDRFKFEAEGAALGAVSIPPGKVKFDQTFNKEVETHRGELRIELPVTQAAGPFKLSVVSQGCADAGLCYPPMTSQAKLAVEPVTASSTAAPREAGWGESSMIEAALQSGRFWRVVGVFTVLGLLLSLTPCVLPMLPILSSILVGTQQPAGRLRGFTLSVSYSLGMALVYTALGLAAGLAGEGLSAALQTPWVLGAFALLLVGFSLSMFDVYELRLPARFTNRMSEHSQRLPAGQVAGVFAMGALSALIVSPCVSAPLAGALLYISQTRDALLGGAALFAMACGMSVPLLLLGISSGRWLPRSGPWMNSIKHLFGVLMLGVAIWVVQPVLPAPAVLALWGLLLLVLGFMLRPFHAAPAHHQHALRSWLQRALGVTALTFGVTQLVGAASGGRDPLQPLSHLASGGARAEVSTLAFQPVRSEAELDAVLARAKMPVMLDFYADWCVSCKEMERFTFSDPGIQSRLSKAVLLKADVTANTEADKALLRRFQLFGPPGTIFFDASGAEVRGTRVIGFQSAQRFGQSLAAAGL